MKRAALLGCLFLAGCGGSEHRAHKASLAGELHQPGAPVVRTQPRPAEAPEGGSGDGRSIVRAAGASCGRERWAVKTATDAEAGQIKLAPIKATVAELGAVQSTNNGNPDQPRTAAEQQVYEVTAELVEAKRESDSDYHLVLHEGPASMIAEIPAAPACTVPPITERVSVLEQQIESARTAFEREFGVPQGYPAHGLEIHHQVTLTGVLFFDALHGQTGVAQNGAELHPVLTLADP